MGYMRDKNGRRLDSIAVLSDVEQRAAYAPHRALRPTGNRAVVIGTSLESYGTSGKIDVAATGGPAWFNQLAVLSRQRVQRYATFGVPGATLAQIRDNQLPQVLALTPRPNVCFIGGPANDTSTGFSISTIAAVYAGMVAQLRTVGITPILCLLPPRGSQGTPTATIDRNTQAFNRWVTRFANTEGLLTLDLYAPVVFGSGGGIQTAFEAGDGTHLSEAGYRANVQDAITRQGIHLHFPFQRSLTVKNKNDATDLMNGNGVFYSSAPGWTVAGVAAPLTLAASVAADDVNGSWLTATRAPSTTGDSNLTRNVGLAAASPGDRLAVSCRIRTSGLAASGGNLQQQLVFAATGGTVYVPLINGWQQDIADGLVYTEVTVPAGATGLTFDTLTKGTVGAAGNVVVQLAEVGIRNLTTLGIDAA